MEPLPSNDTIIDTSLLKELMKLAAENFFCYKDPIYLQSVTIHSANGGKDEGCLVEEYSVALLC
jgi:hypothetical protein